MRWTLSSKLVVAYSGLIALTAGALSATIYWQLQVSQRDALRDRLLGTISLASHQIDGDYHALLNKPEDQRTAFYTINQRQLQDIQASDPDIVRLFTVRSRGGTYQVVLDYAPPQSGQPQGVTLGTVWTQRPPLLRHIRPIKAPITETAIIEDPEGRSVLYGYAPIRSKLGRIDGILVIEMDAKSVTQHSLRAIAIAGGIFGVVLLLSLPLVWWLGQSLVVRPTLHLNRVAQRLADGQWDERLPIDRHDEFGQLANSFNEMAQQLQLSFHQLQDYSENLELKVKERTQKLQESQQLLNLVMNHIPQSIFWKDRNSVYLGSNQSFAEVAGETPESIVGKTDYELPWSREEADFFVVCDRRVMLSGEAELGIVEPQRQADGKQAWLETSKVPLLDGDDQVVGILGIFQDITPYKEAEAAAQQASQAKSEFLANMSHELRTPLNGILGYAQILTRNSTLGGQERHGVNIIHQCGNHLLTLINDILDLAKIEARKLELLPTDVHLPSLLQSVVEMCSIKAKEKELAFIYQPSARLPEGVQVDEKRLRQVLINLLGNAIKFTEQGAVTLQIEVVALTTDQVSILFQVMDTGVGIAADDLIKLFEAFEQVGNSQKQSEGTGLGLAISQRIVKLMGGDIQVHSQLNQGSEFYFTVELPLVADWANRQPSNEACDRIIGYEGHPCQILVVDDRWENRAVVQNLLEPLGFTIAEAENGQAALERLHSNRPDLVITDWEMPIMNGLELLHRIRNADHLKDLKVVVSSASVSQTDQQIAFHNGGDYFLAKPVDAANLFQMLAQSLNLKWRYQGGPEQEAPDSAELVIPPRELLEELLALAEVNRIIPLKASLTALKELDSDYGPFADALLNLAKQYLSEEIAELLQEYIDHAKTPGLHLLA